MKDADYTQKTQTLAEERNMLQQRQQQFENDLVEHEQFIENIATLKTIDTQLSQFNDIDWQELAAQNPQQAIALSMQYQQLRDTRQNQATELSNMSQYRRAEVERKAANNHKAALDALTKPDPTIGWDGQFTPERSKQMTDFGASQGLSMGFMNRVDEPAFVRIMHLAMAGEAALKQQRNPTPQKAQPTRTVGSGRTASSRDPDKMTPNEWRIWREADIRKKTGHP
jgi:myosin heavy subunit